MAKKTTTKKRKIVVKEDCVFCKTDQVPSYKEYKTLSGYLTNRARIVGRSRSGICSKHQRVLTREIKRARHLGLLPFTPSL
jgi:small subunit ribosomal protein S18